MPSFPPPQPDNPDHQADRTGDGRCGRRYYYAAITCKQAAPVNRSATVCCKITQQVCLFTGADWIAGQVLDEIDRLQLQDSTVVVVHADHGWHLGEYVSLWTMISLLVSSSECSCAEHVGEEDDMGARHAGSVHDSRALATAVARAAYRRPDRAHRVK